LRKPDLRAQIKDVCRGDPGLRQAMLHQQLAQQPGIELVGLRAPLAVLTHPRLGGLRQAHHDAGARAFLDEKRQPVIASTATIVSFAAKRQAMIVSCDSGRVGEGRALALVPGPPPWHAAAPTPAPDRQALEDEHTRVLAHAVGDHLPYELVLRAAELAAQLTADSMTQLARCVGVGVGTSGWGARRVSMPLTIASARG
jgi:hypothetical protein